MGLVTYNNPLNNSKIIQCKSAYTVSFVCIYEV